MKAVMSDKLREIISDPNRNKELLKLGTKDNNEKKTVNFSIDGQKYKVEYVSQKNKK